MKIYGVNLRHLNQKKDFYFIFSIVKIKFFLCADDLDGMR